MGWPWCRACWCCGREGGDEEENEDGKDGQGNGPMTEGTDSRTTTMTVFGDNDDGGCVRVGFVILSGVAGEMRRSTEMGRDVFIERGKGKFVVAPVLAWIVAIGVVICWWCRGVAAGVFYGVWCLCCGRGEFGRWLSRFWCSEDDGVVGCGGGAGWCWAMTVCWFEGDCGGGSGVTQWQRGCLGKVVRLRWFRVGVGSVCTGLLCAGEIGVSG
ncbi:hypothetical protein Droror1_Dr00024111 [Drosera rotundifolia]